MQRILVCSAALFCCLLSAVSGSHDLCQFDARVPNLHWYYFNGFCFSLTVDQEGWFGSEKACQRLGGHLVAINDRAENNFVQALALCYQNIWIGMVKTGVSGSKFSWWNDRPGNYTEPFSRYIGNNNYDCVHFAARHNPAVWYNIYCNTPYHGICMVQPTKESDTTGELRKKDQASATTKGQTSRPHMCPEGWLYIEDSCYYVSSSRTNYFNAQLSCEALGATVASVRSLHVQTTLTLALGCSTGAWIGLEKVRPCLTDSSKSHCWMWLDGSRDDTYSAWAPDHPSKSEYAECAFTQGQWRSANCYSEYVYICSKKM